MCDIGKSVKENLGERCTQGIDESAQCDKSDENMLTHGAQHWTGETLSRSATHGTSLHGIWDL